MELSDQVIVMTGAGHGIGKALCLRFAKESPSHIVAVDVDIEAARKTASEVNGTAAECDVANEAQVRELVQQVESNHGRIDLFCANAGIAASGGAEADNEIWRRVMDVNFTSHVYSSRAVLPGMIERGHGYLLHTASAAGLLTQIGSAPYAVSKHAAVAYAEWLSITHQHQGIRVSCLCPMGVWTNMLESDAPEVKLLHETAISAEEVAECVVQGIKDETFLILPHEIVGTYLQHKASDRERWLDGMRRLAANL